MGLKSFFERLFGIGKKPAGGGNNSVSNKRLPAAPRRPKPDLRPDYGHLSGGSVGGKERDGGNQGYYDLAMGKIANDDPSGWRELAVCYENGWVVEKNPTQAKKCRKKASELEQRAWENAETEEDDGPKGSIVPPSNSDPKEYLRWHLCHNNGSPYLKLVYTQIKHGDPAGWVRLGHCYKIGSNGLPKNSEMAEKCSKMAQRLGGKKPAPKPSTSSGGKERQGGSVPPRIIPEPDLSTVKHSPFHVSMVAPSGFGKTTLLVTIMNSAQNKMDHPKKGLKVACEDKDDEKRLKDAHNKLNDDIMAGAEGFTSKVTPTLPGTGEPKKFNFYFQQAEEEASFRQPFSIMDIPGGWINPNNRISDEMEKKWEAFKEHLHESRLLFVPIDATLIMEYGTDKEQVAAVKILDSGSTSDLIKEWAKYRKGELEETGRISALFFVPVKCEKYRSKAKELETRVKQFFANTSSQVHDICSDIQQYYIPLETLGCVEFAHGKWETEEGKEEFRPVFHKVNKDAYLQPKNVEILFAMMYKMAAQELEITMDKFDPKDKEEFQGIIAPLMKELKSNGDISSIEEHRITWGNDGK